MRISQLIAFLFILTILSCQRQLKTTLDLSHSPKTLEIFSEGFISTALMERDIAIAPDGQQLIYTLGNYKQTIRCLVKVDKQNGKWGAKQVMSFSGKYQDIEPFFSPDGKKLYFASNRPIGGDTKRKDYNIWFVEKTDTGWTAPKALSPVVNTEKDEFYPAVSKTGNLYFTATRENGIGREDIFISQYLDGAYQTPVPLDSNINTAVYEFNAYINPEEDLLIFSAFGRKDGLGGSDLYYSKKNAAGQWMKSKNMGPKINSTKLDYCPFVDYSTGNFYFTSERVKEFDGLIRSTTELEQEANKTLNGMGNIYRIKLEALAL